jgi:hypothetical protein
MSQKGGARRPLAILQVNLLKLAEKTVVIWPRSYQTPIPDACAAVKWRPWEEEELSQENVYNKTNNNINLKYNILLLICFNMLICYFIYINYFWSKELYTGLCAELYFRNSPLMALAVSKCWEYTRSSINLLSLKSWILICILNADLDLATL